MANKKKQTAVQIKRNAANAEKRKAAKAAKDTAAVEVPVEQPKLFTSAIVENSVQAALFVLRGTPCNEVEAAGNKEIRVQLVCMVIGAMGLTRGAMSAFCNVANVIGSPTKPHGLLADVWKIDAAGVVSSHVANKYAELQRYGHAVDGVVGTQAYCAGHVKQCHKAIMALRTRAGLAASLVDAVNARLVECQALWPDGTYASIEPCTVELLKQHADNIERLISS